jgi:hypothetical protein
MGNGADDRLSAITKEAEARASGYAAIACEACGKYTLVLDGTSLKCDTCDKQHTVPEPHKGESVVIVHDDGKTGPGERKRVLPVLPIADAINQ